MDNTFILGETLSIKLPSEGLGVGVSKAGLGVRVTIEVSVGAGNIKVIAGKGIKVVVGVIEGVPLGVYV